MKDFYRGKRVFLTGHTGFKGSWLLTMLTELGADVCGYALAPEPGGLYASMASAVPVNSVLADIRDMQRLEQELLSFQPDLVFHLAAQPLVLESYKAPVYTYEVNAMGTANLLEAVRKLPRRCSVVIITTDKVYHNNEWLYPYRENDRLGGFDPYSASKACAEIIATSFRSSYFSPDRYAQHQTTLATARAGNVIGGGDWSANRLLPDIVKALLQHQPVALRHPLAVRPWQHVLDALYGYLLLGSRLCEDPSNPVWADAWNFGPSEQDHVPVEQVVQWALESWGSGHYEKQSHLQEPPHEAGLLRLDCSKARQLLKWKPLWTAREAVARSIDWYKQVQAEGAAAAAVTKSQVRAYLQQNPL